MALSGNDLKDLIITNLTALGRDVASIDQTGLLAISNAIISHITTSGVVNTSVVGTSPSGAVTGTGTGTLT